MIINEILFHIFIADFPKDNLQRGHTIRVTPTVSTRHLYRTIPKKGANIRIILRNPVILRNPSILQKFQRKLLMLHLIPQGPLRSIVPPREPPRELLIIIPRTSIIITIIPRIRLLFCRCLILAILVMTPSLLSGGKFSFSKGL